MQNSKNQIDEYNKKLFAKLFPNPAEPIKCNSVLNPDDETTNLSFAEIAQQHLEKIIENAEFDLEFEQIKHNLKID